jgi:mannose-1-phosphate guanylyltransferase
MSKAYAREIELELGLASMNSRWNSGPCCFTSNVVRDELQRPRERFEGSDSTMSKHQHFNRSVNHIILI